MTAHASYRARRWIAAAALLNAPLLPAAELDFYQDIHPFLKANCISCHNKTTTKAGLNMESPELIKKGGDSGPGLVPGKGAESLIVLASLHEQDMEMPPAKNNSGAVKLTPAEIERLKQWIDQGAKDSVRQERAVVWQPLPPGVQPIYSVAMTPDGRYAACGRSNEIFVYDLAARQFVTRITDGGIKSGGAHRAPVLTLAFSADGRRLASGSFREVKIWRLTHPEDAGADVPPAAAGEVAAKVDEAVLKKVGTLAKTGILNHGLSADGKRLVTGCADGSVRVWDAAEARPLAELRGTVATGRAIAALERSIALQDLEQAFQKSEATRIEAQDKALDELLKKANEAIVAMKKVLPEKQKAVQPAREARAAAEKAVAELEARIAAAVAGPADAAVVKELKDAQEKLLAATTAENSAVAAVSAAESNTRDAEEDVRRISDTKAKNARDRAAANAAAAEAKNVQTKAAAELTAAKLALTKKTTQPVAVAFSTDAQQVAAVFTDGSLHVWGVASGRAVEQVEGKGGITSATLAACTGGGFAATLPDGARLTTQGAGRWVLERTLGGEKEPALFADRVNAVCFSPDGKTLATGGGELSRSGDIILFDAAGGKVMTTWKDKHEDSVISLDFSPDGRLLASGGSDKIARVTEIATGKQTGLFEGHTHHVMGVAFRADGRVLATAGADGVVITWDLLMGERKKKIEGWTKEVTSLQFIGATKQILTSAGDNLVRIVNDDGGEVRAIANLPEFMQAAASAADGSTLIGGGEDSLLRVWDGASGKELAAFGAK